MFCRDKKEKVMSIKRMDARNKTNILLLDINCLFKDTGIPKLCTREELLNWKAKQSVLFPLAR